MFIRKEYEKKLVADTTMMRNAMLNALYNVRRKKGAVFKPLWTRRIKTDFDLIKSNFDFIKKVEAKEKGWVEQIYRANGLKPPKKKKNKKRVDA